MKHYSLLFSLLVVCALACKKDKQKADDSEKRLTSFSDGNSFNYLFSYDEQKRLTRLDFSTTNSLRITYLSTGLLMQYYGANDQPDPFRKLDFTIVNGRIKEGHEYRPNGQVFNYLYSYDEKNRLSEMSAEFDIPNSGPHEYNFTLVYDEQDNVSKRILVHTQNLQRLDSTVIANSYHVNKNFISWRDMGFDYFGAVAASGQSSGEGTEVPFPFIAFIKPGKNALQSAVVTHFTWNVATAKWIMGSTTTTTTTIDNYKYDETGRLINYLNGIQLEWK